MALTFPTGPTPGQVYTASNGINYTWNSTLQVWTAVPSTSATTFGLGLSVSGSIVKASVPQQSTPPAAGTGAAGAIDGSLYWDDTFGAMFIRYNNAGSPTWVQIVPDGGGLDLASLPALP